MSGSETLIYCLGGTLSRKFYCASILLPECGHPGEKDACLVQFCSLPGVVHSIVPFPRKAKGEG